MGPDVHAGRVGIAKINSLYLPPIFETVDMTVKAVVPIRKGSQRVKDKNLRPFGDTTLLELKIGKLKEAGIRSFRYSFTIETPKQIKAVMDDKVAEYTNGHYKRGVE